MRISVLTPTVPERAAMLRECRESVEQQTLRPFEYLILCDTHHEGVIPTVNKLIRMSSPDAEWVTTFADDDIMYPDHLESLAGEAERTGADIVYSWCDVAGRGNWSGNETLERVLKGAPVVGSPMFKRDLGIELGGYRLECGKVADQDFYRRALAKGYRLAAVERPTWLYRFHDTNYSLGYTYK